MESVRFICPALGSRFSACGNLSPLPRSARSAWEPLSCIEGCIWFWVACGLGWSGAFVLSNCAEAAPVASSKATAVMPSHLVFMNFSFLGLSYEANDPLKRGVPLQNGHQQNDTG